MSLVLDQPHLIDTLRYRIQARKTLPQEDLRLAVRVTALVHAGERDQAALEGRIREALAAFVAAAWSFSRIERDADAAGYERVGLVASARVRAAENWNLTERARLASREGLQIGAHKVDYSLSRERVDTAFDELRLEILRRAEAQARTLSEGSGRTWRVGDIAFGAIDAGEHGQRVSAKGAYRDQDEVLFAALDDSEGEGEAMAGAERISLVAAVTLKAFSGWQEPSRHGTPYVVG